MANTIVKPMTNPAELRLALQNGVVSFAFQKKDGSLRIALGTTNLGIIPQESHPTGRGPFL